jgi:L-histidine Nalpha-methyltransferase
MNLRALERATRTSGIVAEVLAGLQHEQKQLPPKLFYDDAGAALFERICTLPEYYPTRTELGIMRAHALAVAAWVGPHARIIEFGSGSGEKTRVLLENLDEPDEYIPIDIAADQLRDLAGDLSRALPGLRVTAIHQDYTKPVVLPASERRSIVFFPGSTIGNFEPEDARAFLERAARLAGTGGGLLIGVDLRKDRATLERAYNDATGVTAEFNLNMLSHINRICDADFDISRFVHYAPYNEERGRIEMYLVSREKQVVTVAGVRIPFERDEPILTEYSYKYDIDGFQVLAREAGFTPAAVWTDPAQWFSVQAFDVV